MTTLVLVRHGETQAALTERIVGTIKDLVRTHPGQRLLVVTHGGPIRVLLSHILRLTGASMDRTIDNTSLTELRFEPSGPRIVRVNDVQHLAQRAHGNIAWEA